MRESDQEKEFALAMLRALWAGYHTIREYEEHEQIAANDFVFLCELNITPDLTLEETNGV